MADYKLGRIHDHQPPIVADLMTYATKPLPPPAAEVAVPAVANWQMALNDQFGDCTIAEVVHDYMAWSAITKEPYTYPGDPAVERTYFGLTGADSGLVISKVLAAWRNQGLFGQRIDAYAPVAFRNTTLLQQCVEWFGVCRLGVNLPAVAEQQFNNGEPWDLTGTAEDDQIAGGHDVCIVGYDSSSWQIITWGRVQPATTRWLARYTEEAWAVIPPQFMARGGDARGLSIVTLQADLASA